MMKPVLKMELSGTVHNHPERVETEYHSWPEGVALDYAMDRLAKFSIAFDIKSVNLVFQA